MLPKDVPKSPTVSIEDVGNEHVEESSSPAAKPSLLGSLDLGCEANKKMFPNIIGGGGRQLVMVVNVGRGFEKIKEGIWIGWLGRRSHEFSARVGPTNP